MDGASAPCPYTKRVRLRIQQAPTRTYSTVQYIALNCIAFLCTAFNSITICYIRSSALHYKIVCSDKKSYEVAHLFFLSLISPYYAILLTSLLSATLPFNTLSFSLYQQRSSDTGNFVFNVNSGASSQTLSALFRYEMILPVAAVVSM
jgi:hypothetical protein